MGETGYAGKMGTGYAAKTGTGYAIPNFPNGGARQAFSESCACLGNEAAAISSGKLGIA